MVGDAIHGRSAPSIEREGSPEYRPARLWDDGIIDPLDTRRLRSDSSSALNRSYSRDHVRRLRECNAPLQQEAEAAAEGARASRRSYHHCMASRRET